MKSNSEKNIINSECEYTNLDEVAWYYENSGGQTHAEYKHDGHKKNLLHIAIVFNVIS